MSIDCFALLNQVDIPFFAVLSIPAQKVQLFAVRERHSVVAALPHCPRSCHWICDTVNG
jgi:hypothetical protein